MPSHKLFTTSVAAQAPAFIIYSPQLSPRLDYVCCFIFKQVLAVHYELTSNLQAFQRSASYRINYSTQAIEQSVQIIPQPLLFEGGVNATEPQASFKNGQLYFFAHRQPAAALHFDVLAAVFYFISRYEEWQQTKGDDHQRFEAAASLLYKHKMHLRPVVDEWINELKTFLQAAYSEAIFPPKQFKVVSTIDVDNLFAYQAKGFLRTAGACAKDLLKFDIKNLKARLAVISGRQPDPFDIYDTVTDLCNELQIPLIYFFLFKSGTAYDRTVDPRSPAFKKVITRLQEKQAGIGLHPSYNAAFTPGMLQQEVNDFSKLLGEPVKQSRQHFLRFDIRTTPALLLQQGIDMDFTMGFASAPGFRAGTSQPFYYYNLQQEQALPLLFVPFCAMDGAYFVYDKVSPETTLQSLLSLAKAVKKTGGFFITVFHERTFYDHLYPGFGPLYKNLHQQLKAMAE